MVGYKVRTTRKELYNHYGKSHVLIVQSEDLWKRVTEPTAYWGGVYGWNCDVVFTREYAFVHGYRPCGIQWDGNLARLEYVMRQQGALKE